MPIRNAPGWAALETPSSSLTTKSFDDDDSYYEEEIVDEDDMLPGITEGDEDSQETVEEEIDEYEKRSTRSLGSVTEVELDEEEFDQYLTVDYVEEEYFENTVREDDVVDEVTFREEDLLKCNMSPEDDESSEEEEEDDGVSVSDLTETIEYVLRQEKAVSRLILTEEQAEKMAHLPKRVMKIIVDHFETAENEGEAVDWDFLLKIVCPILEDHYCDDA